MKSGKTRGGTRTKADEDVPIGQALVNEIPSLRAFANALCRDPTTADDLVQETLVRAWGHLDSFEWGTNLKAWLFTILRNTYYTEWRKRRREFTSVNGEDMERVPAGAAQPGHMHLQDFRKALQGISDDRREALILVGAGGFSYKEAAKICGCSVGTIKSRVSRARAELAELLDMTPAEVD